MNVFTSLLPIAIMLISFVIIIFLVYHYAGKKTGKITSLVLGGLFLVALTFILFGLPASKTQNAAISTGEKVISQTVRENYPGVRYSVEGRVVTHSGETYNHYNIKVVTDYDETSYKKFNKDVCMRLSDSNAELITTISRGGLSPQQGQGGTCQYWLSKK